MSAPHVSVRLSLLSLRAPLLRVIGPRPAGCSSLPHATSIG